MRAALADARIEPNLVAGLVLGCVTEGAMAARTIALAGSLPETSYATVIDSGSASGLEAILTAATRVAAGEAACLVAGGAESISTAPWRVARPRNPYQIPHFIGYRAPGADAALDAEAFEADEQMARRLGFARKALDDYVVASQIAAQQALDRRRFLGEIVGARSVPEEMRDQVFDVDDLEERAAFRGDNGVLTDGNTSGLADAAAFAVVVSGPLWEQLGRPPGLVVTASSMCGVAASEAAFGAAIALRSALAFGAGQNRLEPRSLGAVETSEASAVEALALIKSLKLDSAVLNSGGGALVRGRPLGAASAVSFVRLFSRMTRYRDALARTGAVAQRAAGGIALAAIFEAVGG